MIEDLKNVIDNKIEGLNSENARFVIQKLIEHLEKKEQGMYHAELEPQNSKPETVN